jgi:hypothetical protein
MLLLQVHQLVAHVGKHAAQVDHRQLCQAAAGDVGVLQLVGAESALQVTTQQSSSNTAKSHTVQYSFINRRVSIRSTTGEYQQLCANTHAVLTGATTRPDLTQRLILIVKFNCCSCTLATVGPQQQI